MLEITIQSVPHHSHRYETCGDWQNHPNGARSVRVSEMNNPDYEFLIALHEMIEQHLCIKHGVTEEAVNDFDITFEKNRMPENVDEPGNDPKAPYRTEHKFASMIEQIVATELGVEWNEYEKKVEEL